MRYGTTRWLRLGALLAGCVAGCSALDSDLRANLGQEPVPVATVRYAAAPIRDDKAEAEELPAPKKDAAASATTRPRPNYGQLVTLPIDLPTVLRLVDEKNPAVQFAHARVREAEARLAVAEVQWLPSLTAGATYNRFDGQTQNQRGEVFGVSRANLFASGGPMLSLDVGDAIYRPLVSRRVAAAEEYRSQAVMLGTELDAVLAYLDLVQVYTSLDVNADTLRRAESLLTAARNAKEAKLDRTAGDVERARSEVLFRQAERAELEGRVGVASARLGRLLLLEPGVRLVPTDTAAVPVTLIDPKASVDDLVAAALATRPDLAAHREAIAAAWQRVRAQALSPLLPKVALQNQTGAFGGGKNDDLQDFNSRNQLTLQVYWELRNFGLSYHDEVAAQRAALDQAHFARAETQARLVGEIVEAAQVAAARYESLDLAENAVKEATELYRINQESIANVVDPKNLFDALRPLQAVQLLNQARLNYLAAVLDFTRAQYRLYALIGNAPRVLMPGH